jgi:RNA polymerase sigma factor (sigma-70 family)
MDILSENWDEILIKVVRPLWHKKFESLYTSVKLDYDDFESLAGLELSKAMSSFNSSKSNIFTYSTTVITNKAKTEYRNWKYRDKRKADVISESLNKRVDENEDMTLGDLIVAKEDCSCTEESDAKIIAGVILSNLKGKERGVIYYLMRGFKPKDIAAKLHVNERWVNNIIKDIASRSEIRRIAVKYGLLEVI